MGTHIRVFTKWDLPVSFELVHISPGSLKMVDSVSVRGEEVELLPDL